MPSIDATLLFEVEGFSDKLSSLVCLLGGRSSLISFMSKDEGFSLGRTKSLVLWREQDMCLLAKVRGDVYKLLRVISGEGLVVESLENQPKDTKTVNLEVCSVEGNLGFWES